MKDNKIIKWTVKEDCMYYTPKEVGKILKVNYRKILEIILMGDLPAIRVGRLYRIHYRDLTTYVNKARIKIGG